MPFPFLIGAGVLLSGLAAAGGYLSAKEKMKTPRSFITQLNQRTMTKFRYITRSISNSTR